MTDAALVLELLYGARHRYRAVRGVLESWHNPRRLMEAHRRRAARQRGRAYASVYMVASSGESPAELPSEQREMIRLWYQPPDRLREEVRTLGPHEHERVVVRDGEHWWTYSPDWGAMSNVGVAAEQADHFHPGGGEQFAALLDPSVFLVALEIDDVEGGRESLGRPALRVRGRPRLQENIHLPGLHMLDSADACQLLVDRERGVVLKLSLLLEGDQFWGSAFTDIAFDERFPDDIFVFEPPPGEKVRPPDVGRARRYTVAEAAAAASFTVFMLPRLPEGEWHLHVHYSERRERPPLPEMVHLAYHRADATEHISVSQQPPGEGGFGWTGYRPEGPELEEVERNGLRYTVCKRDPEYDVPASVMVEREGTAIQLTSTELDEHALLALAESLVPAEGTATR